jgi:ATP-dependent Clp protease ATP-binding subunit ClpA
MMKDLSDCAIQCLFDSEESARLMGLPAVSEINAFKAIDVTFAMVQAMAEVPLGVEHHDRPIPFSSDTTALIARGFDEQLKHHHSELNSGHLLLGLLGSEVSATLQILSKLGENKDRLRTEISKILDSASVIEELKTNWSSKLINLGQIMNSEMRTVLLLAERESRASGHFHISTEHVLIGLISQGYIVGDQPDFQLVSRVRIQAQQVVGPGSGWALKSVPFTPRTLQLLELASERVTSGQKDVIGVTDVLQVLFGSSEGIAARIIKTLNLRPVQMTSL